MSIWEKYLQVAKEKDEEVDRIEIAQKIIKELRAGKEGKNLKMIRLPKERTLSK